MPIKLNLGCGREKLSGFIGIDLIKTPAVDIVHDLNKFPYPFRDNSVDEIIMDNILEHLENTIGIMEEIYRICKNGATTEIYVPYFKSNSAFTDPTHKVFFTETSFKYFEEKNPLHYYTKANFEIIEKKLIIHKQYKDVKHFFRNLLPFKKLLNYFLFNIYDEIYFKLKCVKDVIDK